MKLSILIPTLPERSQLLKRVTDVLNRTKTFDVEIKIHDAGPSMTTREKRNQLIRNCTGDYFCFVDDDDIIPEYYIKEMLDAISKGPDVVTFIGHMTTDGTNREDFTIRLGSKYESSRGHHYRFPNHLCAFKKSLVEHIRFPNITVQEDFQWAKMINDKRILKSEVHINKHMYHYDYRIKSRFKIR